MVTTQTCFQEATDSGEIDTERAPYADRASLFERWDENFSGKRSGGKDGSKQSRYVTRHLKQGM